MTGRRRRQRRPGGGSRLWRWRRLWRWEGGGGELQATWTIWCRRRLPLRKTVRNSGGVGGRGRVVAGSIFLSERAAAAARCGSQVGSKRCGHEVRWPHR